MRKQYHFRPSEKGLLAWDIHRLIELSKNFPVIEILLADIRQLDEAYWFESKAEQPTCRNIARHAKLMNEVEVHFPIILFNDGRVADGMHRVCRAWMEGKQTIQGVRFTSDPAPDYIGISPDELPY